ncbi:MAG: histidine triad nucleotide-binding protein [Gemmatimonadales bacterium]
MNVDCIFCRIAAGEIPATIVAERGDAVAFRDVNPQAPTHVLVVPREHIASVAHTSGDHSAQVLGNLMRFAVEVAATLGLAADGYRLVVNTGRHGGQTVDHLHIHLLGGRQLHWPPG